MEDDYLTGKAYYFLFQKFYLLLQATNGSWTIPLLDQPPEGVNLLNVTPLDGIPVKTGEVPPDFMEKNNAVLHSLVPCHLRQSYYKLPLPLYLKAGKCAELLHWDANSHFCPACGAPMRRTSDISKRCDKCGYESWPVVAVAVIVLIHRQDEVLLVQAQNLKARASESHESLLSVGREQPRLCKSRAAEDMQSLLSDGQVQPPNIMMRMAQAIMMRWRKPCKGNFYGLVSGFVETGETLEEAVRREVMEETGLQIDNITYFGSQPWPYPSQLMVGFNADYVSGEIKLQQTELSNAEWFTKDKLPQLPEKLSIARKLIDNWLQGNR